MTTGPRDFICVSGDYVRMDAIAYVKNNPSGGFTIHLKGGDHTFTISAQFAKEFDVFLNDHTALAIIGELPTGGRHSGPLR
jgi:hypothetical protein